MSNVVVVLNALVIAGMLISAILAIYFESMLSSIIAIGVTGCFAALEFILLHAPDVAIAEASVGAVLSPVIFIVALRKVKEGEEK